MGIISDHPAILSFFLSIAVIFIGWIITWQKMRDKLDSLQNRADENRNAIQKSYVDLKELFISDMQNLRRDHDRTREIVAAHISDTETHQNSSEKQYRTEWRSSVMDRLSRIENILMELRQEMHSNRTKAHCEE